MTNKRSVVLISGGLDSATVLAYALSGGYETTAVSFDYGQRHSIELESGERICQHYGIERKVVNLDMKQIGGSSLTSNMKVETRSIDEISESIPTSYVPARNTIFLSVASAFAEVLDADTIFIGANAVDYSGYPDCRPKFFNSMEDTINLGTKRGQHSRLRIAVPLQYLTKGEIISLGMRLKVPYDLTHSCYNGEEEACGECDSCLLRLKGFMDSGFRDPVKYKKYPDFYKKYIGKSVL
ncbi:7-cyano-7-deazaguanine synthase QueC [Oxyplasma meridianum]|uniref:7-cyano-7-deazaguanine synthase n=1 Tax=Oxyplasma meridianum TaxID=3073602 RepID=A0AAX4NI59_9ARCH